TLSMVGVHPDRITYFDGDCWTVDRLFFPELPSPSGSPSPHAIAWLRHRFLDDGGAAVTKGGRRIYVTRRDATQRRLLNEDEIVRYLDTEGFEIVCPGDYSVAEQVRLFRDADLVVATHGAGCTNMVFAPSGATLVELFGDNYVNGCFWAISNIVGQR